MPTTTRSIWHRRYGSFRTSLRPAPHPQTHPGQSTAELTPRGWGITPTGPLGKIAVVHSPGGLDAPDPSPNLARSRFLEPGTAYSDGHEESGTYAVARLRAVAARYPHDPGLATLLAELHSGSAEFAEIWATNPVRAPGHRTKSMEHPEFGRLSVNCDVVALAEDNQ
ncbi:MmyB family transcriptional regulator [Streptacidiphilus neutrinimicus]|uniref:MmyB family transcriptional regulator n=1 Tax=Streptacidiphilus neutrinimicus TaxID=105420 RepID=UPI001378DE7D|nr:hypothetical protein [Streptacidiphilus neutrinimicus]